MNFFLKQSIIFIFPIIIIIVFPFIFFYANGEFISANKILELKQNDRPIIIGKIYPSKDLDDTVQKIELIKIKRPNVITFGNSRVMQIRDKFFKDKSFYNGGGISNLIGFKKTLEKLNDEEKPKIILVGLEQSYMSIFSESHEIPDVAFQSESGDSFMRIVYAWRKVYTNIFTGKYPIDTVFSKKNDDVIRIGVRANMKNQGMRNDGSYEYGTLYDIHNPQNEDYEFNDTLKRMEKGINLFYHGDEVSEKSIAIIIDFLEYCKTRNIYVIGFLPPYPQEIYDRMKVSGEYGYIFRLEEKLKPIFQKYGDNFFDFSNMNSFGGQKDEIVDGLHASEKAYLRIIIQMAKKDKILHLYTNDDVFLESMLQTY